MSLICRSTMLAVLLVVLLYSAAELGASSSCSSSRGTDLMCQPQFVNIAQLATIEATSTCGSDSPSSSRYCQSWTTKSRSSRRRCFSCLRNASAMIDRHARGRETFWLSAPVPASKNIVNVTLDLPHLFEVYYITIELCNNRVEPPSAIVLYKSLDQGATFSAWHFFAQSCKRTFRMRRTSASRLRQRSSNSRRNNNRSSSSSDLQPLCFSLARSLQEVDPNFQVLPFNPMFSRSAGLSSGGNDFMRVKRWLGLTNLKMSLMFSTNGPQTGADRRFCVSDVSIGGRGQCFGHARTMRRITNGSLECECEHGTTGPNCERCLPTHSDSAWQPLWASGPAPHQQKQICAKCHCHTHASQCHYDPGLFSRSGHGSVCKRCQHHTSGANCEICRPGYYRNPALPPTHVHVCKKCSCHKLGSKTGTQCHSVTGQCVCKTGVGGKRCNRCIIGYQMTSSAQQPCAIITNPVMMSTEERCDTCGRNKPRIRFRKFCRKHLMMKIKIMSREVHGSWTRFGVRVSRVWRMQNDVRSQVGGLQADLDNNQPIWVENADLRCHCPEFVLGKEYLLLTQVKQRNYVNRSELVVDKKSTVLLWRSSWTRRLDKFKEREKQGKCSRFRQRRGHRYGRWSQRRRQRSSNRPRISYSN